MFARAAHHPRAPFLVAAPLAALIALAGAQARAADCPWQPTGNEAKEERIQYGAPFPNTKQSVVWGRAVLAPEGKGLAFGGQDQRSEDGVGHTCIRDNGRWLSLADELRQANPLQPLHDRLRDASKRQQDVAARLRYVYFQGAPAAAQATAIAKDVVPAQEALTRELAAIDGELARAGSSDAYRAAQAKIARERIAAALAAARAVKFDAGAPASADTIRLLHKLIVDIDRAADPIGAEPPPRAASPLAYDPKTGLYVVFGGDHFDYMMNDTWVFEPRARRWQERHPKSAPPPRLNHALAAPGDGTVTMSGGLTYTSGTNYLSGQYAALNDGTWSYDIAADDWRGTDAGVEPGVRAYRKGRYLPDAFLDGPRPDAAQNEARLASLPANTWTALAPMPTPVMNRTWGTTALDPDHDLLLRWSGGHKAHNGTDVLHYHLATNRWELPIPVEFALGAIYSWEMPGGVNFNRRPWMTFHTYRTYVYDRAARAMIWEGRGREIFVYDPVRAEWTDRLEPPAGMAGGWQANVETGAAGTFLHDTQGRLWRYDAARQTWSPLALTGVKLPTSKHDYSALTYDPLRNRLLVARTPDNQRYDGQLYAVDLATLSVTRLNPQNSDAAMGFRFIAWMRHDTKHDLMLVGTTTAQDGPGRIPAYDPSANRWITLKVGGTNPYANNDQIWSLGLVYDEKRDLFWTVDDWSRVYALRLDPATADIKPLALPQ